MKKILSILFAVLIGTAFAAEISSDVFKIPISKDMVVYSIHDGDMTLPSKSFVDALQTSSLKKLDPNQKFHASLNSFMIQYQGQNILVDAGNHDKNNSLVKKLESIDGVKVKNIKIILVTHVHPDHIGGLYDEKGEPCFPNAVIYMSHEEWKHVSSLPEKQIDDSTKKFLSAYRGKIRPMNSGEPVGYGIILAAYYGHTAGHSVFKVGKIRFAGDIVHAEELQFKYPEYCASFDANKKEAVRSRLLFFKQAVADGTTVFAAHIPFPGVGTIVQPDKQKDSFQFVPMFEKKNASAKTTDEKNLKNGKEAKNLKEADNKDSKK